MRSEITNVSFNPHPEFKVKQKKEINMVNLRKSQRPLNLDYTENQNQKVNSLTQTVYFLIFSKNYNSIEWGRSI